MDQTQSGRLLLPMSVRFHRQVYRPWVHDPNRQRPQIAAIPGGLDRVGKQSILHFFAQDPTAIHPDTNEHASSFLLVPAWKQTVGKTRPNDSTSSV